MSQQCTPKPNIGRPLRIVSDNGTELASTAIRRQEGQVEWHYIRPGNDPALAAVYIRNSTDHQRYSRSNRAIAIREYAVARGIKVVRILWLPPLADTNVGSGPRTFSIDFR